jgi:hypothetical protein
MLSAAMVDRDLRRSFAGHVCAYLWWVIFCGLAFVGAGVTAVGSFEPPSPPRWWRRHARHGLTQLDDYRGRADWFRGNDATNTRSA